jgi:hypothetical protein
MNWVDGKIMEKVEEWREGGDLNPRVLADNGLAIHRLAGLGHLRFFAAKARVVIKGFVRAFFAPMKNGTPYRFGFMPEQSHF